MGGWNSWDMTQKAINIQITHILDGNDLIICARIGQL